MRCVSVSATDWQARWGIAPIRDDCHMIRGELELPPRPRMASAGRRAWRWGKHLAPAAARCADRRICVYSALTLALGTALATSAWAVKDEFPQGTITEVRVNGNVTIGAEQVRAKLLSKPGGPLDQHRIDTDLKTLMGTKWFSEVTPYYSPDPNGQGYILTFAVVERPVLTSVEFKGLSKGPSISRVSLKDIEDATGLKKGNRADPAKTRIAVGQIQRLYVEKGYDDAEVQLIEGGNIGDTKVVMSIFEGKKHQIGAIDFEGNTFATDATLRLKIMSKTKIVMFGGKYVRENLDEDRRKLIEYYQGQGFYDVKVTPVTETGATLGDVAAPVRHFRRYPLQGPQHLLQGEQEAHLRAAPARACDALGPARAGHAQGGGQEDADDQVQRAWLHRYPDPPRPPADRTGGCDRPGLSHRGGRPVQGGRGDRAGERADQGQGHPPRGRQRGAAAGRVARPEPARRLPQPAPGRWGTSSTNPTRAKGSTSRSPTNGPATSRTATTWCST